MGFRSIILVVMVASFIGACVHDPYPPHIVTVVIPLSDSLDSLPNSDTLITLEPDCDLDSVYFVNDILPLIGSNCAINGCHDAISAQKGVILTDYDNIINTGDVEPEDPESSDIYEVITETDPDKRMPPLPSSALSSTEIELIELWIKQGALNNSCDDCASYDETYTNTVWPIIEGNCTGCHSGSNPQGGILLSNYIEIEQQALSGALLGSISWDENYSPMPDGLPQLDSCAISSIRAWIEGGAQEN